jgi:protein-disulfide isomerase
MVSSWDMDTKTNDKYLMPGALLVGLALIAGAVYWNGQHPSTAVQGTNPTGTASAVNIKDVNIKDAPYIGEKNAPVTMAFWSDFQCPYCKAAEVGHEQIPTKPAMPEIVKNYVDTGKVKVVFMDLPLTQIHPNANNMALYGRSVWKLYPEQYFAWREAIFAKQGEKFGDAASVDALNATIAGLDAARIKADVQANTATYQKLIDADVAQARKFGINGTPGTIIGKEFISGAYPYERFQTAIETVLN